MSSTDILVAAFGATIGWGRVVSSGRWIQYAGVIGTVIGFIIVCGWTLLGLLFYIICKKTLRQSLRKKGSPGQSEQITQGAPLWRSGSLPNQTIEKAVSACCSCTSMRLCYVYGQFLPWQNRQRAVKNRFVLRCIE